MSGDDDKASASTSDQSVPVGITTSVMVGVVGTAINIILLTAFGFFCLRRRNSHKDIDDFIAEEETTRAPAATAAPRIHSAPVASLDGVENPSFDVYATVRRD